VGQVLTVAGNFNSLNFFPKNFREYEATILSMLFGFCGYVVPLVLYGKPMIILCPTVGASLLVYQLFAYRWVDKTLGPIHSA
jgi:hypothetical protein